MACRSRYLIASIFITLCVLKVSKVLSNQSPKCCRTSNCSIYSFHLKNRRSTNKNKTCAVPSEGRMHNTKKEFKYGKNKPKKRQMSFVHWAVRILPLSETWIVKVIVVQLEGKIIHAADKHSLAHIHTCSSSGISCADRMVLVNACKVVVYHMLIRLHKYMYIQYSYPCISTWRFFWFICCFSPFRRNAYFFLGHTKIHIKESDHCENAVHFLVWFFFLWICE